MDNTGHAHLLEEWSRQLDELAAREPVAIGVSGGSDSLALMHVAAHWAGRRVLVTVVTVDHGLREGSDREAETVARKAARLGLDHVTLRWEGPKPTQGLAERAREARYGLMTGWCAGNGVGQLLVAHTLDDQAETLLMRLARGSGVDGLSAMAPATMRDGITLIRPLLGVARADLRTCLAAIGEDWIDDPTNEDSGYERIRIRQASAMLGELGLTTEKLAQSTRRLQRARSALDEMTDTAMGRYVEAYPEGYCRISVEALSEPEEVVLRVFSRCLSAVGGLAYPPRQSALESLCQRLRSEAASAATLGGCQVRVNGPQICVVREAGRMPCEPMPLNAGERRIWDGRFRVSYGTDECGDAPAGPVDVRPLTGPGWEQVRHHGHDCPAFLRDGLVSFWREDVVLAVPHLNYRNESTHESARFSADFSNFPLLRGARIAAAGGSP